MKKTIDLSMHERAERLMLARQIAKLSRAQLAVLINVSASAVTHWENLSGTTPGITEKKARIVVETLKKEGLEITFDWLMNGNGKKPFLRMRTVKPAINHFHFAYPAEKIVRFIEQVTDSLENGDYITFQITDDSMHPDYIRGDFVIGLKISEEDWEELDGKVCLIMLSDNEPYVRLLKNYSYHEPILYGTNTQSKYAANTIVSPNIKELYQIVAHFKWGNPE